MLIQLCAKLHGLNFGRRISDSLSIFALLPGVKHAVKVASEAVKCGKCVVISLQSTGEARTLEQIENDGELSDFVSTEKGVLRALVEKHFPDRSRVLRLSSFENNSVDPESYGEKEGKRNKF
jgi:hypothetical protein